MDRKLDEEDEARREPRRSDKSFDTRVLEEPIAVLPSRKPLLYSPLHCVSEAIEAMQGEDRGAALISEDGTPQSPLVGIFTDRDVLLRVVGRGRNPAVLPLREVMTPDPEVLPPTGTIAWVLNRMAISGYRHIPVVDDQGWPMRVVSVRDVVHFLVDFFPREVLTLPPQHGLPRFRSREGA